jgi:hypothetical protein
MTFMTGKLIAEADQIAMQAKRRLRRYRHRLAQHENHSLEVGVVRLRAERTERELKRIDLYRAVLKSGPTEQALTPEYVLTRWSRNWHGFRTEVD